MMMEQYGYGMTMGGYAHVPEYVDGYPVSPPYGGLVRESGEDADQGLYERRAFENCWDRMSNDSGCKSSSHSNNVSIDDPYILSSAPGRDGGGGSHSGERGGGGRGRGREQGGEGEGTSEGVQLSPNRPTQADVEGERDDFNPRPHHPSALGHHLLHSTRLVSAPGDDQFSFVDWRDFAPCPGQYYPVHEAKKYGEVGDFGERSAQSIAYLPQAELYDCPAVAATYPTALYPGSGQALPFCHPSPPGTTAMSDGWPGGSSATSDEATLQGTDETEKRRNPYRAAAAAALTVEPNCSSHRSQGVTRYPSTSSSSLSSSRRGLGVGHSVRKQGSTHHPHQRRWYSDLTDTIIDDDERKLRERDRKKKDNHNLIERKRRLNINANIQVLGTLLPPSSVSLPKDSTQNKGNILRATVEFVQSAQQKIERVHLVEHRLRDLNASNRQLRCKLKDLETFLRSAGLYEDYLKTVGDKGSLTRSSPVNFDAVKEEMNFSPASLQRQESDVTDDFTGG